MNFTRNLLLIFLAGSCLMAPAQFMEPKIRPNDPVAPDWVKLMNADNPNVFRVDSAYKAWYRDHPFRESSWTRYYMRWRNAVSRDIDRNGYIIPLSAEQRNAVQENSSALRKMKNSNTSSTWTFAGPLVDLHSKYSTTDTVFPLTEQANSYCIDQSISNPDELFIGTESGGVYRSVDKGQHWMLVSQGLVIYSVNAIAINPANENEVIFGASGLIYKTTDGGSTWYPTGSQAFQNSNVNTWQIEYNPVNTNIVYAACDKGFYRTTDGGTNWNQILPNESMSLAIKPGDANTVYALQYNNSSQSPYFYKSTNGGQSFTIKPTGWFQIPTIDLGKIDSHGGRIAVTKANPDRVYVLLVGNSNSSANLQLGGYIGVYSSINSGDSWTLPQQLIGEPYDLTTHPNLMDFDGHSSTYNQIYYNTALIVSQVNENRLLIGGLNLWRSDDGAATYQAVGGYIGSVPYYHVDIQEMKVYKTSDTTEEAWIASDGGVNYSLDFAQTHVSRCNGIQAGAFWGFDQGWNNDIMVGGRYHNGNGGFYQDYPAGTFLALGGGEAPTGYVNYSDERKTYFSDIGGKVLPVSQDSTVRSFSMYNSPNESYWENNSSRIVWDWHYWNVAYMGKENKLMRSVDGGSSFMPLYEFTNHTNNQVLWIEQCFTDPNVFYVQVVIDNVSQLLKSTDGGTTWSNLSLPVWGQRNLVFTTGYNSSDEIWIAFEYGGNGSKVYRSLNGGTSWTNLTTSTLNNLQIKAIACQGGTDGTVYIAGLNGFAYYRINTATDWTPIMTGLPDGIDPLRLVPFYRDRKIRLGTWNMAIWQIPLQDSSRLMANFSANYATFYCPGDTLHFVNHSVCSANAICHWSFPGGTPSTSTLYNPKVVYSQAGTYDVTLIVTDGNQVDTVTRAGFITTSAFGVIPMNEGFETGNLPGNWKLMDAGSDGVNWAVTNLAGGFGKSSNCLLFDNYDIDVQGRQDEVWTPKLDFSQIFDATIKFDVAYSQYGGQYSDTLAVLATGDCGDTYTEYYRKGGLDLATAPNFTSSIFIPDSSQWRTDSVVVSGYGTQPEVIVAFRNVGHWGQAIYVDNVRVGTLYPLGVKDKQGSALITILPNPCEGHFRIVFENLENQDCQVTILGSSGMPVLSENDIPATGTWSKSFDISLFPKGMYLVKITTSERVIVRKLVSY
jgi:photosystem II stability/assembly factor-like uncharacterized protein